MSVPPLTPTEFYTKIVTAPCLVVAIAPGVVRFDDTVERQLNAFRADIAFATVERGLFDQHDEFFRHVRERSMWGPSVLLPEDGYYLFQDGFFETFHPALHEGTDVAALGIKKGSALVAGLLTAALTDKESGFALGRQVWEESGGRIAQHFIRHMKQRAGAAK